MIAILLLSDDKRETRAKLSKLFYASYYTLYSKLISRFYYLNFDKKLSRCISSIKYDVLCTQTYF